VEERCTAPRVARWTRRPPFVVRERIAARTGQDETAAVAGRGEKTAAPAVSEVHIRRPVRRGDAHVPGDAEPGKAQRPGVEGGAAARDGRQCGRGPAAGTVRHERAVPEFGAGPVRHGNRARVRARGPRRRVPRVVRAHAVRGRRQNVRHARPEVQVLAVVRVRRRVLAARRPPRRLQCRAAAGRRLGAGRLRPEFRAGLRVVRQRRSGVRGGRGPAVRRRRRAAAETDGRASGRRSGQRRLDGDRAQGQTVRVRRTRLVRQGTRPVRRCQRVAQKQTEHETEGLRFRSQDIGQVDGKRVHDRKYDISDHVDDGRVPRSGRRARDGSHTTVWSANGQHHVGRAENVDRKELD